MAHVKKFGRWLGAVLIVAFLLTGRATAQDDPELRITGIDLSDFPTVGVRLLTRDAGGAPLPDLSGLVLRENRAPIPDFELARVPTGVDLVFVLDANDTFLQIDDTADGLTRRDKVAAGVELYARQFMNPTGLDRVTVIAPDEAGGVAVLAEDITTPADLAQVVADYQPVAPPRITPLNDMLAAAIDHLAAQREDGHFQSVVLYTDGARLDQQLAYQDLVSAAQAGGVGLSGAILGATADPNEVASLERLATPTRGRVIHMPDAAAAEPLYRLFQSQSQQTEARYRSLVRRSGEVEVSAALGNIRAVAPVTLDLAQPLLTLNLPNDAIRRAGSAIDTPLPLLQPAVYPLSAQITWPDGIRRDLTEFAFLVNGRREPLPSNIAPDADGRIQLAWDISNSEAGAYDLQVQARDVLGFAMDSQPQTVTITIDRPQPLTPTPEPTVVPVPSLSLPGDLAANDLVMWLVPVLFALGVLGALGLWFLARRRRAERASAAERTAIPPEDAPPPVSPVEDDSHIPTLERLAADGTALDRTTLTLRDTLIGRDPNYVTLVLDDSTVARLHARLRQTGPSEFWLYDEGSTSGTFLNHTRLGLAPRPIQHGDHLQFGRVAMRFTLQRPLDPAPRTPEPDPIAPAAEELPATPNVTEETQDIAATGTAAAESHPADPAVEPAAEANPAAASDHETAHSPQPERAADLPPSDDEIKGEEIQ